MAEGILWRVICTRLNERSRLKYPLQGQEGGEGHSKPVVFIHKHISHDNVHYQSTDCWIPTPEILIHPVNLGEGLRICISNQFSGDVDAPGSRDHTLRTTDLSKGKKV